MHNVRTVVNKARHRVWTNLFLRSLPWTLTGAFVIVIVLRLVERIVGINIPTVTARADSGQLVLGYREIAIGLAAVSVLTSLIYMLVKRPSALAIAREVDDRADLKESLSTALCVEKSRATDPWASSMIETAESRASKVHVNRVIPFEWTRAWAYPVAAGVGLLIIYATVPKFDLAGLEKKREEIAKKQADIVVAKSQVKKSEDEIKKALEKAGIAMKENDKTEEFKDNSPQDPTKPAEILRPQMIKLTNAADKLQDAKDSEKAKELAAMKEMMEQLKQPGPGPLDEMSRMMARGDFAKAEQAMKDLTSKLAGGDMKPEQKEQLQKQMQNLSKQLQSLAQNQKNAAETMKKAGLDEKTAQEIARKMQSDPAAAKEQLQKELDAKKQEQQKSGQQQTPEQKKAEQQSKAMCDAGMKCDKMGEQMGKMAENMGKDGMSQQGQEAMAKMSDELGEMKDAQQMANNISEALSEIQQQMDQMGQCMGGGNQNGKLHNDEMVGDFKEGDQFNQGGGSGSAGRSGGGRGPEEEAAPYKLTKEKANVKTQKGQIISSKLVWGEQVKGESVAEFSDAVEQGKMAASEAFETMRVHKEYQGAVKHYFGRLEDAAKKAKGGAAAPAAPSGQAPANAAPAPDAKAADSKK